MLSFVSMFNFQAKIPSCSGVCVQGEWQKYTLPFPPFSKNEGLKDIGHKMSIAKLILGVSSVTVYFWFVLIFYNKMRHILLQNTTVLLQNATVIGN